MTSSILYRCAIGTALAALLVAAPIELAAQAPAAPDPSGLTASGSYLAARHAGQERDAGAAAAYYRGALKFDPKNGELLDRAFLSLLVDGNIDEAVKYAVSAFRRPTRTIAVTSAIARRGGARWPRSNMPWRARPGCNRDPRPDYRSDRDASAMSAWSMYGTEAMLKAAVAPIDKLTGPDW